MKLSTTGRVGVVVVAVGTLVAVNSTTAAAATISFNNACVAGSIIGPVYKPIAASVSIDAPDSVNAGADFSYTIHPGPESYPDRDSGATTVQLSRLKFDIDIPSNATYKSSTLVGAGSGLAGVAPQVLRVNTAGVVDPNGSVLRISGNNEVIANSPTSSTNTDGGITVPKTKSGAGGSTPFQLPGITVNMTAGTTGDITPHVRVSGNASQTNNDENFSTSLASATFLGAKQWAPTRCSPKDGGTVPAPGAPVNAGGQALATIKIGGGEEPGKQETTTTLTAPSKVRKGLKTELIASVAPHPTEGRVVFHVDGRQVGSAALNGGVGTLPYTFKVVGIHRVTASFLGGAEYKPSTSNAVSVRVTRGGGSLGSLGSDDGSGSGSSN